MIRQWVQNCGSWSHVVARVAERIPPPSVISKSRRNAVGIVGASTAETQASSIVSANIPQAQPVLPSPKVLDPPITGTLGSGVSKVYRNCVPEFSARREINGSALYTVLQAYEVVKGALVRACSFDRDCLPPPTVVLVHGILGSKRNMQSFARRLMEGFPSWQAILVDLRCHGESAGVSLNGPNGVESSAQDVLSLLSQLKVFPRVLIGHSFGGKVVMSMAQQFGQTLPRPVQAWVLDALPGAVRAGEEGRVDHPFDLIQALKRLVLPLPSRANLIDKLTEVGFSHGVASWMTTNLRPMQGSSGKQLTFSFDILGVEEMYKSYENTDLWPLLASPPEGLKLDFVRAERSIYRWGGLDGDKIQQLGHDVHVLGNSGHWVHTDNPDGLFDIIRESMGAADLHMLRTASS